MMLQAILGAPMGIVRILDLLRDPHEVIRNEAVLLLASLTRSSADIQKIAAFEGAFEHILKILECVSATTHGAVETESPERAGRASVAGPMTLCALVVRAWRALSAVAGKRVGLQVESLSRTAWTYSCIF